MTSQTQPRSEMQHAMPAGSFIPPPATGARIWRSLGAMLAGILTGAITFSPLLLIIPGGQEAPAYLVFIIPIIILTSGAVTGYLLCKYCPSHGIRQYVKLFAYSPFNIPLVILFLASVLDEHQSKEISSIFGLLVLSAVLLIISWIGPLIGYGVHAYVSKRASIETKNQDPIKVNENV